MLRVRRLICCKNDTDLEKIRKKYPSPQYKLNIYSNEYPIFLYVGITVSTERPEIFQLTPKRMVKECDIVNPYLKDEKAIEICNSIKVIATKEYEKMSMEVIDR